MTSNRAPMRILLLSTGMGMGGADQQILNLAHAMRARGHQVRIVVLAPLGPMGYEARDAGIPIDSLEMRRDLGVLLGMVRLLRLIRAWRPDVVHSHLAHANIVARALRPLARGPALVSTIHSINDGGRLRMAAYRLTKRVPDRVTIVSQLAAEHYLEIRAVAPDRLEVVPNAVDVDRFERRPEAGAALRQALGGDDGFIWLAVGRFELAKDYPTMIAAFARLAARRPRSRLWLVGTGSLQAEVEGIIRASGLEDRVSLLGTRRDVPELMSAADAYVLSSAWEGMPVVLLEAAAMELPIVATRVGGVAEVVHDGETGTLIPAGDPDQLAEAMERMELLPAEARRALGASGRRLIEEKYGTPRLMARWERIYGEVVSAGHR